eukprot:4796021-Pleurochrysis_carterae.AAC.1
MSAPSRSVRPPTRSSLSVSSAASSFIFCLVFARVPKHLLPVSFYVLHRLRPPLKTTLSEEWFETREPAR